MFDCSEYHFNVDCSRQYFIENNLLIFLILIAHIFFENQIGPILFSHSVNNDQMKYFIIEIALLFEMYIIWIEKITKKLQTRNWNHNEKLIELYKILVIVNQSLYHYYTKIHDEKVYYVNAVNYCKFEIFPSWPYIY